MIYLGRTVTLNNFGSHELCQLWVEADRAKAETLPSLVA